MVEHIDPEVCEWLDSALDLAAAAASKGTPPAERRECAEGAVAALENLQKVLSRMGVYISREDRAMKSMERHEKIMKALEGMNTNG